MLPGPGGHDSADQIRRQLRHRSRDARLTTPAPAPLLGERVRDALADNGAGAHDVRPCPTVSPRARRAPPWRTG